MNSFFAYILLPKNTKQTVSWEMLHKNFSYEKAVHEMLLKLTPGSISTTCLCTGEKIPKVQKDAS